MKIAMKTTSVQVILYLIIQCLSMWILSDARVNPSRMNQGDKKIQKRVHRTHKSCQVGSNEPLSEDPCDVCRCVNGITRCHKKHCPDRPVACVDAVIPSDGCCSTPVCPNGPNCWHKGKKMNGRRHHKEKDYDTGCVEICSCPPVWRVEYNSETEAECRQHCPIRRSTK